ncbi:hypothetical protein C8R48DRAFT_376514 [Suillus tomentosus]|nr:hypothetical protein C8R48DRAFT_376514 [Suillus tomentosus]
MKRSEFHSSLPKALVTSKQCLDGRIIPAADTMLETGTTSYACRRCGRRITCKGGSLRVGQLD